jgi:class 3 adenylate cyclase
LFLCSRHYFEILFSSMASRGRIVKTIGDAVMASFATVEQAIEAVTESLVNLKEHTLDPESGASLEMRVGLHCGPALVVPVNGINDYFGQTVNISARVQSKAGASQCLITEAALSSSPSARAAFERALSHPAFVRLEEQQLTLKGVSREVTTHGLRLQ